MATIKDLKALVAPDVLACPDPIVNREVVSALLEFCARTQLLTREMSLAVDPSDIDDEQQNSVEFDVVEYMENLRAISVLELQVDNVAYVPKKRYIQQTLTNWDHVRESGVKYYHITESTVIRVYDFAATDSSLYLRVACKPTRDAVTVDDALFEDWSDAIVAGAKAKLLAMPGKDWSDPAAAEMYRREWRRLLSQAKIDVTKNLPGNVNQVNWVDYEYGV